MAEATVTFLLENLQKLLREQIYLISGAEYELRQLQDELELMKAFLEESASKREKGEEFRQLERQIREVVYRAEDTLDACLTEAAARKSKGFVLKNLKRLDLAKMVKTLREKEVQPAFQRARLGFESLPIACVSGTSTERPKNKEQKTPLLIKDNVVGFEDEAETLINYLNEETEELDVISITGMPGSGKTTLAWKIYRDIRIQRKFPTLIWVYISQDFNIGEVLLTILKMFSRQDMSSLTDSMLADIVRSCLENLKFLLFIDGVHTTEDWKDIEAALPKSNRSGKVLITSCHEEVADQSNCKREPHRLRCLNRRESWELLQLEVFGKLNVCPPDLELLGNDIASQCGGLPLAIVVMGGILVEKFSTSTDVKDEWKKVSASVSSYLNSDRQKRMENRIALSYNKLPHDLRDCFLYLGMFPKDTEIPAWKLIRLWIAEGFIQRKIGKSLEEVARDNLKDLTKRNLVIVDKTNIEGDIKTCRVPDMIYEFCKSEAAFARQNLFQEVKRSTTGNFQPAMFEISNSRRLCIHSYVLEFFSRRPKGPFVRSFLCFSKEAIILQPEFISLIFDTFGLLRVLDANPIKFTKFPTELTRLIHLRYIALSGERDFSFLPESFSKLWNLQTIKIDTMSRTYEIRANIWKMMQLRHLKTKAAIILSKRVTGEAGENLQTLSRLSAQCCTEDILNRAPNLKNLGIRGQLGTLLESKCLEKLDRLQKLKLVHDVPEVTSDSPLPCLPQPDRFPPNLRILILSSTFLNWDHMATLGMLRTLEVLKLKNNAFMGRFWEAVGGNFPSLEFLHIAHTDLEFWTATDDSFPKLRCLELKNCEKLVEIPTVLAKSLQKLDIERVTESAVESARRIESEKQHIQSQQKAKIGGFKLIIAPRD